MFNLKLILGFQFQNSVSNESYDLAMLCAIIMVRGIAIITSKDVDYCCIIFDLSKSEAIHLVGNSVLNNCEYISNTCQRIQY